MDCLNNRISIKGCGAPVSPEPQLFVNHLPGITLQNIEALTNSEHETFLGVWNNVVLRTLKKFEILLKSELNKCYSITEKTVVECLVCEKVDLFDVPLWYLHGVELMIERTSTDAMNRYTTIDFEKAERLKEEFYNEFTAALRDAVRSMDPSSSDCIDSGCVECNDNVKWVTQLP